MSAVDEAPAPAAAPAPPRCAHCDASLEPDQEWCLECGTARTLIHPAPDWRVPVAIVGAVVLLVLAAFAIALASLSSQANRMARATPTATAPASRRPARAAPSRTPSATAAKKPTIAGWPTGLAGWTVVLAQRRFQAKAENVAREFAGAGIPAGVLDSSRHPSLPPGLWIVFSGRYPDQATAEAAAAKLRAEGHRRARAREVAPPGGI